jgi:hypothetical protein
MFESQHQWFDHELRFHRKQFQCRVCNDSAPSTRPELESHIRNVHPNEAAVIAIDAFLDACCIKRIDATECPLCAEWGEKLLKVNNLSKCDVSLKQFQVHLGRHMEQLALSALPEDDADWSEDDGDDGDKDDRDEDGGDPDENSITNRDNTGGHLDASGPREVVFCHKCENEWYRDEHGNTCPNCKGNIVEIVSISIFYNIFSFIYNYLLIMILIYI